jgi:hypothetical protein
MPLSSTDAVVDTRILPVLSITCTVTSDAGRPPAYPPTPDEALDQGRPERIRSAAFARVEQ